MSAGGMAPVLFDRGLFVRLARLSAADRLAVLRASLAGARSAGDDEAARRLEAEIETVHNLEMRARRRQDKIHAMVRAHVLCKPC